jgi:type I restriction enzyme S subunit
MSGWETKSLGEVSELIARGIAPSYLEAGGICVLNQKCVRDHMLNFAFARRHDSAAKKVPADRFIRRGDVLVNSTGTGTLGRVAQVRTEPSEPMTVDTHVTIVRPAVGKFDPDFFGYMLITIEDEIAASGAGASGQTELARTTLAEKFTVSYPASLAEQRRIVAILNEAFTGLATMRANAETNLANAHALFESHREAVFAEGGDGWNTRRLQEICDVKHGFAFDGEFFSKTGRFVLLTPGNFYEKGGYRDRGEKQKYYTGDIPDGYILSKGSLLVAMTEQAAGLLGSPIIIPEGDLFLHNQRLGLVIPKPQVAWDNEFFFHVFNLRKVRQQIHADASGVKVRHTSPSKIGNVPVSYPTQIADQRRIVDQLKELRVNTNRLTSVYRRTIDLVDELRHSILAKAFAGELSSVNPVAAAAAPAIASNDRRAITAAIMARAYERHRGSRRERVFGHVKAQKILHMAEAVAGYELGRAPRKDAAGPNDMPHMTAAERWAEDNRHFRFPKVGEGYRLEPLDAFDALLRRADAINTIQMKAIDCVIDIFVPMDTREAELFATVYAAWNNLLIDGETPADDAIIWEAREGWHRDKLKIDRVEFVKALAAVRKSGMIPTGKGKRVGEPRQARFL